jgi:hypothetical protein
MQFLLGTVLIIYTWEHVIAAQSKLFASSLDLNQWFPETRVVHEIINFFLRKTNSENGIHVWRRSIYGMRDAGNFLGNSLPDRSDSANIFMKKIALALLIIAGCAASLIMLNHQGISSRVQGRAYALSRERFPAYAVTKTGDVYSIWQEKQVHGRIVVQLGRFLHFMEAGYSSGGPPQIATIVSDHEHFKIERTSYKDYLWVAFQTNIARKIYAVLPPADFKEKFDNPQPQKEIVVYEYGSPRIFTTKLPSVAEPVLLNIDASFFHATDAAQLIDDLMKSGLKADIVTICLAEDNPDVTDLDRKKARDFIADLSAHADIIDYKPFSQPSKVIK